MNAKELTAAWFHETKTAAYKPLPDMVDKLVMYFQMSRMKPQLMLRNMNKDPQSAKSVIKLLELALNKTGWAKMWWPKKDAEWAVLMKSVADASW